MSSSKIKPKMLLLHLTKKCNARCPGCQWLLEDKNFFSNQSLSLEDSKNIIDFYYKLGTRRIKLAAEGEVLMHEHYKQLVLYCKKKGFRKIR